jgi:uncharacterized protein YkwD
MLTASLPLLFVLGGCVAVVPVPIGAFASGPIPAASFRQPPAGLAGNLVREVNAYRAANGLPKLSWNAKLAAAAAAHARDLDLSGTLSHQGSRGSTMPGRIYGAGYAPCFAAENISRSHPDAASVVRGWSASPGHRSNMLSRRVREAGAGVSNVRGRPVWVLDLGTGCF